MDYKRIECEEKHCKYGKKHCCFGEYAPQKFEGKKIVERHKCKCDKSKMIYVTITSEK